jgi:hypothetical protein
VNHTDGLSTATFATFRRYAPRRPSPVDGQAWHLAAPLVPHTAEVRGLRDGALSSTRSPRRWISCHDG